MANRVSQSCSMLTPDSKMSAYCFHTLSLSRRAGRQAGLWTFVRVCTRPVHTTSVSSYSSGAAYSLSFGHADMYAFMFMRGHIFIHADTTCRPQPKMCRHTHTHFPFCLVRTMPEGASGRLCAHTCLRVLSHAAASSWVGRWIGARDGMYVHTCAQASE